MKLIMRVVVPKIASLAKTGPPLFFSQLSCGKSDAGATFSLAEQRDFGLCDTQRRKSTVELFDRCVILTSSSRNESGSSQSALEVLLKGRGTERYTEVFHQGHRYKAICLSSGITLCSSMTYEMTHPYPVARIETEGEELVFVTMIDHRVTPFDQINVSAIASKLARESFPLSGNLRSVIFPLIGLNCEDPLPWIEDEGYRGMLILDEDQQRHTIIDPRDLDAVVVDRPFLLWVMREEQLVLAAYLERDSWILLPGRES